MRDDLLASSAAEARVVVCVDQRSELALVSHLLRRLAGDGPAADG